MDLDPMFTTWRARTEQHRSRRKLLCVLGSRNLADYWTRLFPYKNLPSQALPLMDPPKLPCVGDGDFELHAGDWGLVTLSQKNGIKHEVGDRCCNIFICKEWRLFVPVRTRVPLLLALHLPQHHGERKMKNLVSCHNIQVLLLKYPFS